MLIRDDFGKNVLAARTAWLEPAWKMILSNKAILPLLWKLNPDSPFLVPASFDPLEGDYVRKPIHAREGANITVIKDGQTAIETDGPYESKACVYQQLIPLKSFDDRYPVLGSWIVNGWACGLGIREDETMITGNASRFIPHLMSD
jgi:glutathionylspermidine synthase